MKLSLVCSSLQCGGAERVLTLLANYWAAKGHRITLTTLAPSTHDFYTLHESVTRVSLDLLKSSHTTVSGILHNWHRVIALRKAISASSPDTVISFVDRTNVLAALACKGLRTPLIVSERVDPSQHTIGASWSMLRRFAYRWPKAIVVQTEQVCTQFRHKYAKYRLCVIPNPIDPEITSFSSSPGEPNTPPRILAMGRLVHQKGVDLLLRAFAMIELPCHLEIIGEGKMRASLEELASDLGICAKVSFHGQVSQPKQFLRQADIFVLPSRYEGFPNALLEAMACGLPVVSFDCPSGPREILRNGEDGILVSPGDITGLAAGIVSLLKNSGARKHLGEKARNRVAAYSIESVSDRWLKLIASVRDTAPMLAVSP
jgi:glycosyltransferase involved in cell wall biosynthesis